MLQLPEIYPYTTVWLPHTHMAASHPHNTFTTYCHRIGTAWRRVPYHVRKDRQHCNVGSFTDPRNKRDPPPFRPSTPRCNTLRGLPSLFYVVMHPLLFQPIGPMLQCTLGASQFPRARSVLHCIRQTPVANLPPPPLPLFIHTP